LLLCLLGLSVTFVLKGLSWKLIENVPVLKNKLLAVLELYIVLFIMLGSLSV